jgi:hypothetical protein
MPITDSQREPLFQLLKTVHDVCIKNKLRPILTGSALIGIYRDGQLINQESIFNVDHAAIKNKYAKLNETFKKLGYHTHFYPSHEKEKLVIKDKKNGVRVQLLSFRRTKLYYYRRKRKNEARVIPLHFYDNLGHITFKEYDFTCPVNVMAYLKYLYLDWTKLAPTMFKHCEVRTPEYMGTKYGFKKWSEKFYEKHKAN